LLANYYRAEFSELHTRGADDLWDWLFTAAHRSAFKFGG
jgi:hypothetical protein